MKNIKSPLAIILAFSLYSCTSDNKNMVFEKLKPSSSEYKQELIRQLASRDPEDFTYHFEGLNTLDGEDYLVVKVNSQDMEAAGLVLVKNWNGIEGIRRTKGISYQGAELRGLKLETINTDSGKQLIYKGVKKIVD